MNTNPETSHNWSTTMQAHNARKVCDLVEVMSNETFRTEDLEKTRDIAENHPELLVHCVYTNPRIPGSGCLFFQLSGGRISSKADLIRWFTGKTGEEMEAARRLPVYAAPKNLVSAWDGRNPDDNRYDGSNEIPLDLLVDTLNYVIGLRRHRSGNKAADCPA